MAKIKKINRNAFNEKLIHRYLFERYYFGERKTVRSLLPKRYCGESINLIAAEEGGENKKYRADLTIYFKGKTKGVPVEVKWSGNALSKKNQIRYLIKNNGFMVSFSGDAKINGVENISIQYNDFIDWVSSNISKLSRESLIYQANLHEASSGNQFWVVFLRGTAHNNFYKMLKNSANSPFWAFKQDKHALKNIMDMQEGDLCLFVLGVASEGMAMSNNPALKCDFIAWYKTRVKEPYYMVLKGKKGTFFERGNIPINKRRWPHFVDFSIIDRFEASDRLDFGKREEFAAPFAKSVNSGAGAPAQLSRGQWDALVDRLRKLSK